MRPTFPLSTLQRLVLTLLALAVYALSVPASADAQQRNPQKDSDPWSTARDAYRAQDWRAARSYTAAASQRDPKEPRYYLSLARIAFQQAEYEDAVWFYDVFIEYARNRTPAFEGTYALNRAEAERKSANARRDDPASAPDEPDAQVRVRKALLSRLNEGPAIRSSGGGALDTFKSLLRLGYANPDLTQLRTAVEDAAGAEADRLLERGRGRLPTLSYQEWKQQAERYEAAYALIPPPVAFEGKGGAKNAADETTPAPKAKAYQKLSQAQRQYLLHNWSTAARLFHEALEIHPTLSLAHQGRMNALLAASTPDVGAIHQAMTDFETMVPEHPDLAIYRAMSTAAMGDAERASDQLVDLLTNDRVEP